NFGLTHVMGKVYYRGDPECTDAANGADTYTTVIRSIVFPQTEANQPPRQFSFAYNSDILDPVNQQWHSDCTGWETITSSSHGWGSLSQITMPTGAVVNY